MLNDIFAGRFLPVLILCAAALAGCSENKANYNDADTVIDSAKQQVNLPAPFASKSVKIIAR